MKKSFSLVLICIFLISTTGLGQKIIINGKKTDRKLAWSDFTGQVDKGSPFFANTYYNLKYQYNNITTYGEQVSIGTFELTLELDPNRSWARGDKITDELLVHEQGHFNIGILCMREILSVVKKSSFTKSEYASEVQKLFNDIMRKYNEMSVQYDSETDHFRNKEQQEKWNSLFAEKLSK